MWRDSKLSMWLRYSNLTCEPTRNVINQINDFTATAVKNTHNCPLDVRVSQSTQALGHLLRSVALAFCSLLAAAACISEPASARLRVNAAAIVTTPPETLSRAVSRRWAALGFNTRYISVNGVRLHVSEAGQGPPLVLLHGYPQSGEIWRLVAPALAKSHRVIIPDLRGMGLSEVADGGYDLANVSEDIHQLVKTLGFANVEIVGHDWGGAVAATYALRYPMEVTKLVFVESALPGAGFEKLWNFSAPNPGFTFIPFLLMSDRDGDTAAKLLKGHEEAYLHHLWAGFTGDRAAAPFQNWKPYLEAFARPGVATSSSSYYRSAYASADEIKTLLAAGKLSVPVLSIAGAKGIGENQKALVEQFGTNATFTVIPDAGHFVAEERPRELVEAISRFLQP